MADTLEASGIGGRDEAEDDDAGSERDARDASAGGAHSSERSSSRAITMRWIWFVPS
jgi:hypothetical protein